MIGRLSQRKAIQRLSGPSAGASAALFTAMGFTFSAGVDQSQTSNPLVAGRLNSDGSGGPVSGFSLTGTAGLTIPTRAPYSATLSPDGNWLVLHWGNNDASPATQMYKRSGPKTWAYHSGLTGMPNSGLTASSGSVTNAWFVFNAASTRVTSGGTTTMNTPYAYDLVGNIWTDRGTPAGIGYNWTYAESPDGRLRLQLNNGGTQLLYSLDGGAQNTVNTNINSYYGRIWVSPLGTRVAVFGSNLNNDGNAYVTFFSWNGSTLTYTNQHVIGTGLDAPSMATWLAEDTVAFGSRSLATGNSGSPINTTYMHIARAGVGVSTLVVDRILYISGLGTTVQYDAVVDTALVGPGVLGYATYKGILGTVTYSGNTLTAVGPAIGVRQPRSLLGIAILRNP